MKRLVAGLIGGTMLMTVVSAQAPEAKPDPKEVAEGRKLFTSQLCTVCHMAEGNGNQTNSMDGPAAHVAKTDDGRDPKWITDPAEMTGKLREETRDPDCEDQVTPCRSGARAY